MKLYSYFRSSASYRVRIAMHWKELKFEYVPIHLLKDGGQQRAGSFLQVNPMGHVPALDHDGFLVAESVAIIQYLDAISPERPLFPKDPRQLARNMQICELMNSGIQPLQNLKVTQFLESEYGLKKDRVDAWAKHWIDKGLSGLENILKHTAGKFSLGNEFTAADCFVIPQCFASRRFGVKIEDYPTVARVEVEGLKLPAVQKAHPEKQPDYSA
jgi:maleylacetoacetate isomerase